MPRANGRRSDRMRLVVAAKAVPGERGELLAPGTMLAREFDGPDRLRR